MLHLQCMTLQIICMWWLRKPAVSAFSCSRQVLSLPSGFGGTINLSGLQLNIWLAKKFETIVKGILGFNMSLFMLNLK